jgi:hypothetical protein
MGLSARALSSPHPTTMCCKEALMLSALEPTPVEVQHTRLQQLLAHHDAPQSRRSARVSLSAPCRTGENEKSYQNTNH